MRPGDSLEITHVNALPPNDGAAQHDMNIPHHFNTFNLHTHGMHVDPTGEADNIYRTFEPSETPGAPPPTAVSSRSRRIIRPARSGTTRTITAPRRPSC